MDEADSILISALQHWCYCQRQCALIHQEQVFAENVHTLRGQAVHSVVDRPGFETRAGFRVERALPVWSESLGLIGKADVVEFTSDGLAYPVEYKHGSRHKAPHIAACDDLQLGAQALCLEETTGKPVAEGALFYAKSKRRRVVLITGELRTSVELAVAAVRVMLNAGRMPPPVNDLRCGQCSLIDLCQPHAVAVQQMNGTHLRRDLFDPDS